MSAHRGWLAAVSRGVAPLRASTFCPALQPKAMRQVMAAAFQMRSPPSPLHGVQAGQHRAEPGDGP